MNPQLSRTWNLLATYLGTHRKSACIHLDSKAPQKILEQKSGYLPSPPMMLEENQWNEPITLPSYGDPDSHRGALAGIDDEEVASEFYDGLSVSPLVYKEGEAPANVLFEHAQVSSPNRHDVDDG